MRVHRKSRFEPIYRQNAPKCSSLSLCTVEHLLFQHFRPIRCRPSRSTTATPFSNFRVSHCAPIISHHLVVVNPFSLFFAIFWHFYFVPALLFFRIFFLFYYLFVLFIGFFTKFETSFSRGRAWMNGGDDLPSRARPQAGGGM